MDRKRVNEAHIDLTEIRQRQFISEISEELMNSFLASQVKILKDWFKKSKIENKGQYFDNRVPIGTVIPENKKLDSCVILINPETKARPALNQLLLIYDEKYDEILSGIVGNIKSIIKKGKENIVIVVDILFVHKNTKLRKRKHVTQLISDQCLVFETTPEEIEKIFGLPESGIKLGICSYNGDIIETKTGGPVYYLLNPELIKTHLMIGGVTGQGKTIFLKNLIYELAAHSTADKFSKLDSTDEITTNAIIFDLQGDLVQILEPMKENLIKGKFKESYEDLNLKTFAGLKQSIINKDILFLKPFYVEVNGFLELFPWIDFGLNSENIKSAEEIVSFLPTLTKRGSQLLTQLFAAFMAVNNSVFNFEKFHDFVVDGVKQDDKGKSKCSWISEESGEHIESNISIADAMIRQLKVFKTLKVFDGEPEIDIENLLNKRLIFIYFPDTQGYTTVRSIMLLDILSRIYYAKRHNVDQALKNNLIVIDEAHELLPRKSKNSDLSDEFFDFIEKKFTRIAKEGRKYGISLVVSSQILSELNDEVKFNAQTRIFFKLSEKDIKSLKLDKETVRLIDGLRKGYAVIYSRDNLEIGRAIEIKVIPPIFLHCDPRIANKLYESEVQDIVKAREKIESKKAKKKDSKKNFYLNS